MMALHGVPGGAFCCSVMGMFMRAIAASRAMAIKYTRFTQIRHISRTRQVMLGKSETLAQVPVTGLSYTTLGANPNRKATVLGVSNKTTTVQGIRKTVVLHP